MTGIKVSEETGAGGRNRIHSRLAGIGLMALAASAGAILTIVVIGLVNALVWYGRLHFRLLKPAIEPQS